MTTNAQNQAVVSALRDFFSTPIDDKGTPYRHIPEDRLDLYSGNGPRGEMDTETMIGLEYLCLDWRIRNLRNQKVNP